VKTARRLVQLIFLAVTLGGVFLIRGDAERWCPFGGVEAAYQYTREGNLICSLGVSNFYILAAILLSALLLRRAFCGYVCPIGTLSDWLHRLARRTRRAGVNVPYRLDRALSTLKYGVLALVLYFTWRTGELIFRGYDPCYALLSRHGPDIQVWTYVIAAAVALGSLLIAMPFCRWLCPLAAVLSPLSRLGLTRIKRSGDACTACGACAQACPMGIRVDQARQVTAARCISCFTCIDTCPASEPAALTWGPPGWLGRRWPRGVLVAILLLSICGAVAAAWAFPLPSFVASRGQRPQHTATATFQVRELTCRGRATLLVYFLERDDLLEVPGYLGIEAWPGTGPAAPVRITYDPAQADESALRQAITEPYFDAVEKVWRSSPFEIIGHRPSWQGGN
jgi:ferredoxin